MKTLEMSESIHQLKSIAKSPYQEYLTDWIPCDFRCDASLCCVAYEIADICGSTPPCIMSSALTSNEWWLTDSESLQQIRYTYIKQQQNMLTLALYSILMQAFNLQHFSWMTVIHESYTCENYRLVWPACGTRKTEVPSITYSVALPFVFGWILTYLHTRKMWSTNARPEARLPQQNRGTQKLSLVSPTARWVICCLPHHYKRAGENLQVSFRYLCTKEFSWSNHWGPYIDGGTIEDIHASDSQSSMPFSKSIPQTVIEKVNVKSAGEQFNHPLLVWPDDEMNVQAWPETFLQGAIV